MERTSASVVTPLRPADIEGGGGASGTNPNGTMTAGERLLRFSKKSIKQLKRIRIPFRAPSLIDKSQPYFSGVARFGVTGFWNFVNDPFHTLLNLTWARFVGVFFVTYMTVYLVFAFIFWLQSSCAVNVDGRFAHALWLSSRTASTLGFSEIRPNPDCTLINLCVMFEVITSSLVGFIMLGVVFARFSAPFKRAGSMRFSKTCVCHGHPSGHWAISLRVANLRKHQILQPKIRMVVTAIDSITPSNYLFEHIVVDKGHQQETNIELGFPANVVHVISPNSVLYNMSLLEMDSRMMEILVFVDGIDAMTSKYMSARCAYSTSEIVLNQVHVPLNLEMRGKKLGLDFNEFDNTVPASAALATEMDMRASSGATAEASAGVSAAAAGAAATESAGWSLRHQTFRRLAERYGGGQQTSMQRGFSTVLTDTPGSQAAAVAGVAGDNAAARAQQQGGAPPPASTSSSQQHGGANGFAGGGAHQWGGNPPPAGAAPSLWGGAAAGTDGGSLPRGELPMSSGASDARVAGISSDGRPSAGAAHSDDAFKVVFNDC